MFSWRKFVIPLGIVVMFGSLAFAAEPKVWHVTAAKDQTFIVEGHYDLVQPLRQSIYMGDQQQSP